MSETTSTFTVEVRGQQIEVTMTVNKYRNGGAYATFEATVNEVVISDHELEALTKKIAAAMSRNRAKIDINFAMIGIERGKTVLKHGTITGKHAKSGNALVRWHNTGGTESLPMYSRFMTPFTTAEADELLALHERNRELEAQINAIESAHELNTRREVEAALQEAVGSDA